MSSSWTIEKISQSIVDSDCNEILPFLAHVALPQQRASLPLCSERGPNFNDTSIFKHRIQHFASLPTHVSPCGLSSPSVQFTFQFIQHKSTHRLQDLGLRATRRGPSRLSVRLRCRDERAIVKAWAINLTVPMINDHMFTRRPTSKPYTQVNSITAPVLKR